MPATAKRTRLVWKWLVTLWRTVNELKVVAKHCHHKYSIANDNSMNNKVKNSNRLIWRNNSSCPLPWSSIVVTSQWIEWCVCSAAVDSIFFFLLAFWCSFSPISRQGRQGERSNLYWFFWFNCSHFLIHFWPDDDWSIQSKHWQFFPRLR